MLDKDHRKLGKRSVWAALLAVILAAGGWDNAGLGASLAESAERHSTPLVSLAESTRPFEQYFNQTKDQVRFLTLLSPT